MITISKNFILDLNRLKENGSEGFIPSNELTNDEKLYLETECIIRDDRYQDWAYIEESFTSEFYLKLSKCYFSLFNNPQISLELSTDLLENYDIEEGLRNRIRYWEMDSLFLTGKIEKAKEKMEIIPRIDEVSPIWRSEALAIFSLNCYFINNLELALKKHLECHIELKRNPDQFLEIFNASMALRVSLKKLDPVSFDFFSEILSLKMTETSEKRYSLRILGYKALIYDQLGDHSTAEKYWSLADNTVPQISMKWEIGQYYLLRAIGKILSGDETSSLIYIEMSESLIKGSGSPLIYLAEIELIKHLRPWNTEKYLSKGIQYILKNCESSKKILQENINNPNLFTVKNYIQEGIDYINSILNGRVSSSPNLGYHSLVVSLLSNMNNAASLQNGIRGKKKIINLLEDLSSLEKLDKKNLIRCFEDSFHSSSSNFNEDFICSSDFIRKDEFIEFSTATKLINNLIKISERSNSNREELKSLAHDIKNNTSVILNNSLSTADLNITIRRIIEICDGALGSQSQIFKIKSELDKVKNVFNDKLFIKADKNVCLNSLISSEFNRIISNLITNSIEAGATVVNLDTQSKGLFLEIIIQDNGPGIPEQVLSNLSDGGVSTKPGGHGIGLTSVLKKIKAIGGDLNISSSKNGATIILKIPYFAKSRLPKLIVVDDDKYQKISWIKKFGAENLKFYTNSYELMNDLSNIPKDSFFYVDKNLKDEDGIQLLKRLNLKGYENLFLNTSECIDLNGLPHIIANLSKNFNTY
jgi:signal transduction histidine kinase